MKIKRYIADSMRAALALVRAEEGEDAVILSTRRIEEGTEVIAAIDYDEGLLARAVPRRSEPAEAVELAGSTPAAALHVAAAQGLAVPTGSPAVAAATSTSMALTPPPAGVTPALSPIPPVAIPMEGLTAVRREIGELRELLEVELAQMTWNDRRLRDPAQAQVLEDLTALQIAPDVARALALRVPARSHLKNPSNVPLALIARALPMVERLSPVLAGVVALVGPTGAGKTTTIAKLAARWTMRHGSRDLALVSTDAYRIGAREQLRAYARLLDAPVYVANDATELKSVLARLAQKKLVLIDTAGMAPRDGRLAEQIAALKTGAERARVLLALPAPSEAAALEEIHRAFAAARPSAAILTKIDEAASFGAALSVTLRHRLPIAYLCNGQRVPEDLHAACERRVWLARMARRLADRAQAAADGPTTARDARYLSRHFGRDAAHA